MLLKLGAFKSKPAPDQSKRYRHFPTRDVSESCSPFLSNEFLHSAFSIDHDPLFSFTSFSWQDPFDNLHLVKSIESQNKWHVNWYLEVKIISRYWYLEVKIIFRKSGFNHERFQHRLLFSFTPIVFIWGISVTCNVPKNALHVPWSCSGACNFQLFSTSRPLILSCLNPMTTNVPF